MDKKKLQEYIKNLQMKSNEINIMGDKENKDIFKPNAGELNIETSFKVQGLVSSTTAEQLNTYITMYYKNRKIAYGTPIALSGEEYFTVHIDYAGLIEAYFGSSLLAVNNCVLRIWGKSRMAHDEFAIYSLTTNELVGEFKGVNNLYDIDLKNLYDTYGNASFRFVAKWDGTEAISLDIVSSNSASLLSIEVIKQPQKTEYNYGEVFDKTGLIVRANYANGNNEIITNFTISPSGELSSADTQVVIGYKDKVCYCPINVRAWSGSIKITRPPQKTVYDIDESFDRTGMIVLAVNSDGTTAEVTDYTVNPSTHLQSYDEFVTIGYKDKTLQQNITVNTDHPYSGVFLHDLVLNDYVKVTKINGVPVEYRGTPMEVPIPGGFDVEFDIEGYLKSIGASTTNFDNCSLTIPAKLHMKPLKGAVYDINSNKKICDIGGFRCAYVIPVQKVYNLTGSTNFRVFFENPVQFVDRNSTEYEDDYPHEIFVISDSAIRVDCDYGDLLNIYLSGQASKRKYLIGERFNPAGLKVMGEYYYGATREVDYTVTPNILSSTDTCLVISSEYKKSGEDETVVFTVEHPIEIIGQRLPMTIKQYKRIKDSNVWGEWSEISSDGNVKVEKTDIYEIKTVISYNKSDIDLGNKKRTGLRLLTNLVGSINFDEVAHIKVNNITHALENKNYLYIGNVNKDDTGEIKVEIEYADRAAELIVDKDYLGATGVNPVVYFCDALDPTLQSEKKELSLSGGVKISVDLLQGTETMMFTDIEAESTLTGVHLAHVFTPTEGNMYYGYNYRLNIYEKLEISKSYDGPVPTPVYTDATGNKYIFKVIYYCYIDGEKRYLSTEGIKQLTYDANGNLILQGTSVYTDYIRIQNFRYLTSVEPTISNNPRYQAIKSQSNNSEIMPVYWLKADNCYKGFNAEGRLVLVIDEFNNYTEMTYDSLCRLTKVSDGKGNEINLYYSSTGIYNLQKITDSRGRRIEYGYNNYNFLTSVAYYDALNEGNNYKNLWFTYAVVEYDGVSTCVVSKVESSDNTYTNIEYEQSSYNCRLVSIENYSASPKATDTGSAKTVSSFKFTYDYELLSTVITDMDFNEERYVFDENGVTIEYYQIIDDKVSKAEYTEYIPNEKQVKVELAKTYLNKYSYDEIKKVKDSSSPKTTTELNNYNMPTKVTQENIFVTDTSSKQIVTEYEYDDLLKTVKETSTETYSDGKTYKYVTEYTYSAETQLLTKKVNTVYRIVDGSDIKEVTSTEEYTYDSNGCVSLVKSYKKEGNSSTASNIYYTKKTFNTNKQTIKEYDQTGLYSSSIEYGSGTNLVSKVTAPNNNVLNYSYDNEDRVSKMWGTSDGTENANTTDYVGGEIEALNHSGDNAIKYEYDDKRRPVKIMIGDSVYESYEYEDDISVGWYFGDSVTLTNANGEKFRAETDKFGHKEKAYYNGRAILEREYDNYGRLWSVKDILTGGKQEYKYDSCDNILRYIEKSNGNTAQSEAYSYNSKGQVTQISYTGNVERTDTYTYKGTAMDYVTQIASGGYTVQPRQDIDERYTGKTVTISGATVDTESVIYVKEGDHATNLPKQITYSDTNISYTYDGNGNITQIMQGGVLQARYAYDTLGRLTREDNNVFGKSYFYTYDNNGNILAKESCDFTTGSHTIGTGTVTSYTYSKDKMTKFGTQACVYDAVGNPTKYRGKTASWTRGRKLISYNGTTFTYDAQGRRTKKDDVTFCYDSNGRLLKQSNGLEFFYDTTGLVGVLYNNVRYVYRKDLQGNIIAILDSTGNVVVEYKYDAWGNHKVLGVDGNEITNTTHIGYLNPFRYRSYYYDTETKLYYLQTRYYDAEVGRFINMDSIDYADPETINGLNLYSYCDNNPVMNEDPSGHGWLKSLIKLVAAVALVVAVAAASVVTAGAASVILAGAAIGGAVGMVAGGVTGAVGAAITGGDVFEGFADGAFTGAVVGTVKGAMNAVVPGGGSVGALALAQVGSIVVNSAASSIGTVGANILFSKNADRYGSSKIGSNGHYNKQFDDFWAQNGNKNLNTKRKFHDYITKKGYNTWKKLEQAWEEFLNLLK